MSDFAALAAKPVVALEPKADADAGSDDDNAPAVVC